MSGLSDVAKLSTRVAVPLESGNGAGREGLAERFARVARKLTPSQVERMSGWELRAAAQSMGIDAGAPGIKRLRAQVLEEVTMGH